MIGQALYNMNGISSSGGNDKLMMRKGNISKNDVQENSSVASH